MSNLSQRAMELRHQMEQIRCELAADVSDLTADAKTLTDYRYYLRRYPWASVAAAAAVGYLVVPRRAKEVVPDQKMLHELIKQNQLVVQTKSDVNQKRGLIATGVSLLTAAAMRAAMGYAQQQAKARLTSYIHPQDQATTDVAGAEDAVRPLKPR